MVKHYLSQRKQKVGLKSCFSCLKSIFGGGGGAAGVCSWTSFIFGIHK